MLQFRQEGSPQERTYRLHAEYDTNPATCILERSIRRIDAIPSVAVRSNRAIRIRPHIHERCPAEELHQTHRPEGRRRLLEQLDEAFLFFFFLFLAGINTVELRVLLRVQLLHGRESVKRAENQYRSSCVERPFHTIGDHTLRRRIGNTDPGKEDREQVTHYRARIAERRLNSVRRTLLLLIHHIADHHLKRLHGDVDTRIEEHQTEQTEPHRRVQTQESRLRKGEIARIRQQQHYCYRDERTHEQIRFTATQTSPGLVAILSNQRLNNHSH